MSSYQFSEFVEGELEAIWDYIAIGNLDAADRFLAAAASTFEKLARNPEMGMQRKFPGSSLDGLRSFRVTGFENYLIFYRLVPGGIQILNVLHGARDIGSFWKDG